MSAHHDSDPGAAPPGGTLAAMGGEAIEELRARNLRVTPQRRAILGAFRGRPDEHLSADEVHSRASATVPDIGRGTVYATLAELAELGLLASVGNADPIRYETNVDPHDHFRCRLCLRFFDIDLGASVGELEGFVVERVTVIAEGVCRECVSFQRGLHDGAAAVLATRQMDEDLIATLACERRETPLGPLLVAASASGLVRMAFPEHADADALAARSRSRRGGRAARERTERVAQSLESYFGGGREPWADEVDWTRAEEATAGTLEATRGIPYGTPRSYEQLGIEYEAYACGLALGSNPVPILLPCHRVWCGGERPEVWVGGSERLAQLRRLEAETLSAAPS
jgi:Fe2+ or Zn2+ uptake regulation protein/O6-methylguanine-DNA--protein-cysteine methyltransferase